MTTLRSRNWFGPRTLDGLMNRAYLRAEGFSDLVFDGRPVVGVANSWSELNNCNAHLRQVAEAVKRGVWSAGGFPLEFPVISLGEILMKPTTMLFRNLMAMDVEECIRAYPLDAVVLLSGCDKTTPAMLMGAASADVPAIMVTGGPMLRGRWRAEDLGSGTDARRLWAEHRAERLSDEELCEVEACLSRSAGHCMVMGTASTMAAMAEALGMTLPGNAAIPAPDARRLALLGDGVTLVNTARGALIDEAGINTLTVMIMEVPCCSGLLAMARRAGNDRVVPGHAGLLRGLGNAVDVAAEGDGRTARAIRPGGGPGRWNARHAAHHGEAVLLQHAGDVFRGLDLLEAQLAEGEDLVVHHLRQLGPRLDAGDSLGFQGLEGAG